MSVCRLRKALATLALGILLVSVLATGLHAQASPFDDMPPGHWAYDAVRSLVSKGVLSGYPDGTFHGEKLVSRYALAVALAKAIEDGRLGPPADGQAGVLDMSDLETLERLVKEFGDELTLVGVKTSAADEQLRAHAQAIDDLEMRVTALEDGGGAGGKSAIEFQDGRMRALGYNRSGINGSVDAILNVGIDLDDEVDGVVSLRYTNIFDQINSEAFGTYEAYLRSLKPIGPVDSIRLGKMNNFLGTGMVLYDVREGVELKSTREDVRFELSYYDAFLAHVSTDVMERGELGFYYVKQDQVANRRPEHLGVYARGDFPGGVDVDFEFTEYDHDGVTPTNGNGPTNSFQAGVSVAPGNGDNRFRVGYMVQEEDYRGLAVDSDLRWQFPDMKVSPHHDVLQALRDATPAGVDPDAVPGFRDLQLALDFNVPRSPWSGHFAVDMLRGKTAALDHSDDDFDVLTFYVEREMGRSLDFQLRFQALNFDNEDASMVVDALPSLRRQDTSNLRAQVVKRF